MHRLYRGKELNAPAGTECILSASVWKERADAHRERVRPWIAERAARSGEKHPVYDFLFEYYFYRPALLRRWSPGFDVLLEGAVPDDLGWKALVRVAGGALLPATSFPIRRRPFLDWAVTFLEATGSRDPSFGCFGLHEWAMLYRTPAVRHGTVPLRLTPEDINRVVDSMPLRCTHYDAFRFFTPAAVPLNRIPLARATTTGQDQPGCIHAVMDLYKFAFTLSPFSPGELVADAFALARTAREIDMRASPYDLTGFGFAPIRIETRDGRDEYVEHQKRLRTLAEPVRERLLDHYRRLRT
ncbi:MAG TPA: 3-methyladenine DNA glycosylase [Fimbriiglobus sp.]